jgi:hypothetical protein
MRNLNTLKSQKKLDVDVLRALRKMKVDGKKSARAGDIAKIMHCNSVRALGAMERVKYRL